MDNLRKGANNIRMLPFAFWILYGVAAITRPYDYMASICYLMDVCGVDKIISGKQLVSNDNSIINRDDQLIF